MNIDEILKAEMLDAFHIAEDAEFYKPNTTAEKNADWIADDAEFYTSDNVDYISDDAEFYDYSQEEKPHISDDAEFFVKQNELQALRDELEVMRNEQKTRFDGVFFMFKNHLDNKEKIANIEKQLNGLLSNICNQIRRASNDTISDVVKALSQRIGTLEENLQVKNTEQTTQRPLTLHEQELQFLEQERQRLNIIQQQGEVQISA